MNPIYAVESKYFAYLEIKALKNEIKQEERQVINTLMEQKKEFEKWRELVEKRSRKLRAID